MPFIIFNNASRIINLASHSSLNNSVMNYYGLPNALTLSYSLPIVHPTNNSVAFPVLQGTLDDLNTAINNYPGKVPTVIQNIVTSSVNTLSSDWYYSGSFR